MKELSIEQKAQRYDEAIEIAKDSYNHPSYPGFIRADVVFPELKESEGEKIRRFLIDFIKVCGWSEKQFPPREDVIAWLEKQGEYADFLSKIQVGDKVTRNEDGMLVNLSQLNRITKPADKVEPSFDEAQGTPIVKQGEQKLAEKIEPKFHEGEWVFIEEVKGYKNGPFQIKIVDPFGYSFDNYHTIPFMYEELLSKWTIQDVKDGDVICCNQIILLFKQWEDDSDYNFVIAHAGIDISGKLQITDGHWLISNKSKPATKEQCDHLFQKMHESGYKWDYKKKELKKIMDENQIKRNLQDNSFHRMFEHKFVGWSEDDEKTLNSILTCIGHCQDEDIEARYNGNHYVDPKRYDIMSDWLKSIKDRVRPRPELSEEDEELVKWSINNLTEIKDRFGEEYGKVGDCINWLESFRLKK